MDVTVNQINVATTVIVVIVSLINFVLGAIGLILNILVFTRPALRREPCSVYFFSSTCFNLFVVFVIVPVRIVSDGFNMELGNYNIGICKTEFFAFYVIRTISCWLIVFACVDRYLHSSIRPRIRRMSSYKTAKMTIGITIVTITIMYSHMIVYCEITYMSDQFGNITPACYGQKGLYRTFIAFWYMVLYSLCPSFLMLLFGLLTLKNVRQRRQVGPWMPETNRRVRRTDVQLLRMLAAQVFVIVISTLPFCVYRLYASFTTSLTKSTLRRAQENLAFEIAATLSYFAHTSSFYLYTLTGAVFRKELFKIIGRYWNLNRNGLGATQTETLPMSLLPSNRHVTTTNNHRAQ
jgi:hypothetical protein